MNLVVGEVLAAWRDAERLLDDLPPLDPDHETVRLAIASLHETYQALTESEAMRTQDIVGESLEKIDQARILLRAVKGKHVR